MKKHLKNLAFYALIAIMIIAIIYPVAYWVFNPKLSPMEVFFETWWSTISAMVAAGFLIRFEY